MSAQPDIAVVVCTYSELRWARLVAAINSLERQTARPSQVIVVVDHNPALLERVQSTFPQVEALPNSAARGLSGARNSGIAAARSAIVAFLDDDAVAFPDWLARLGEPFVDSQVVAAGGAIRPLWAARRPRWFPSEFDWVVGCSYTGMPTSRSEVRNLIGCNMAFRREVFSKVGGFRSGIGRIGDLPVGCEETELCIRIKQRWPEKTLLYEPAAVVYHSVPAERGTPRYFVSRCYSEGLSKALVARLVGARDGLSSERAYTFSTLPRGVRRGFADLLGSSDPGGLGRAAAIALGLAATGWGYLRGGLRGRRTVNRPAVPTKAPGGKLRVLMVAARYLPFTGGTETHVHEVAQRLAASGMAVTILTTDPSGELPASEQQAGVEVRRVRAWPAQGDLYFAPGVIRAINAEHWDLIHCQGYHTFVAPMAMLAAWRRRIPYVITFHSGGHSSRLRNAQRGLQVRLLGPLMRRANRLIGVSQFEATLFAERLGLPSDRFVVVPNGAQLPELAAPVAQADGPLIVSVGRLEQYKGHQRVIAAMPILRRQYPMARLRIAGAGPYEPALRAQVAELGLNGCVEIAPVPAGDRQAMARLLASAAVFTLLSEYEAHPVAVMEALSLGLPALVSDTSGLGELARRGLVRAIPLASRPEAVAEGLIRQLRQPLLTAPPDLPTWEGCAAQLRELYMSVIGEQ